ncbi:hypothetical protein ACFWYW_51165 [Nonomuraea sp. NPDC059023]|uniref:hypothetical protein n=1 Tax=unclassified Nonomuraea TaxID=2593643 RepID=UPI0036BDCA41
MRTSRTAAIVGTLGLALSLTATPASASSVLSARCSKGNFKLAAAITYGNPGNQHIFTKLTWNIVGDVGSNNDVYFEFWKKGGGRDSLLKVFKMNDVSKSGSKNIFLRRPKGDAIYVHGGTVFDTKYATDPVCKYFTRTI